MINSIGEIKRGDYFAFTADIADDVTGDPLIGAAELLRCQGRYPSGMLAAEMTISETSTPGTYLFEAPSTDAWIPNTTINFDIEYDGGIDEPSSTDTFSVSVLEDITHD